MASRRFPELSDMELRMVMVGKTGNGKSATGNTILHQDCFKSKFCAKSITVDCSKGSAVRFGQRLTVIDTPGLFDTRFGEDKTTTDMSQCIHYSLPGPHVFLVVIRLGRYTEEEQQAVQRIQKLFGQAADRYSMVLFTHGDLLEDSTIEEFLDGSPELQELVARCNNQYHVFNNKSKDSSQVQELLQKIRKVVQKNGGSHYTNEMFQEAERAIEEKKQRIQRENEERLHRQEEERERQLQQQLAMMRAQLHAERRRERSERREELRRETERRRWEREEQMRKEQQEREEERRREQEQWQRKLERDRRHLEEQMEREIREAERRRAERRRAEQQAQKEESCTIL